MDEKTNSVVQKLDLLNNTAKKPKNTKHFVRTCSTTDRVLNKSNTLFSFQCLADDASNGGFIQKEIVKKWRHMMRVIIETNTDEFPVSVPLQEMFHMD